MPISYVESTCCLFWKTITLGILIMHDKQCPPPWAQGGGMIFVPSARQGEGGASAKLQEPGWRHIQGWEMILGSQAGGELLYHDELLVFPQNPSP